jgi:hypothetical protein
MALGLTDRAWSLGDLVDAALATQPIGARNRMGFSILLIKSLEEKGKMFLPVAN